MLGQPQFCGTIELLGPDVEGIGHPLQQPTADLALVGLDEIEIGGGNPDLESERGLGSTFGLAIFADLQAYGCTGHVSRHCWV